MTTRESFRKRYHIAREARRLAKKNGRGKTITLVSGDGRSNFTAQVSIADGVTETLLSGHMARAVAYALAPEQVTT